MTFLQRQRASTVTLRAQRGKLVFRALFAQKWMRSGRSCICVPHVADVFFIQKYSAAHCSAMLKLSDEASHNHSPPSLPTTRTKKAWVATHPSAEIIWRSLIAKRDEQHPSRTLHHARDLATSLSLSTWLDLHHAADRTSSIPWRASRTL